MSLRTLTILAAGLGLTVGFTTLANAEMATAPQARAARITLKGCPVRGVEPGCVMMKGADGTTYRVSGAVPPVPINKVVIILRGTPNDDPNFCFARNLTNIKWRPTRMRCPPTQ